MIVAYEWNDQYWCRDCCPREADATPIYDTDDQYHHLWCALCRRELDVYVVWCEECNAGLCFASDTFLPPLQYIPNSPEAWARYFERQSRLQAWITELYLEARR